MRTLRNAFASGRIAHAFMLTGVRGVGKTTTARLLARALNYETDTIHEPTLDLNARKGGTAESIIEGRHMDVLELDAASRTKRRRHARAAGRGALCARSRLATRSTSSTRCTCSRRRRSTRC